MPNCAPVAEAAYVPSENMPWTKARAMHLHRRIAFGADVTTINAAVAAAPDEVVSSLVSEAAQLPLAPEPDFANQTFPEYGLALLESTLQKDQFAREWIKALQTSGLRGRLALFWHNHFVTRFDVYESASYTYQYHKLLQEYALGNFKDFVYEMGLTPAMLVFLNGTENSVVGPNENYARELYELFTLGDGNGYTQQDIEETARALTGYTDIPVQWGPINFDPATLDAGEKTIFGRTGNWGYDDVVDMLFEERPEQIARFITGKLYRRFVNPQPNEEMINYLAEVFRQANWEIAPLVSAMFSSAHFFAEENMGTIIEGPVEHVLIFYNELGLTVNGLSVLGIYADATRAGQALFNPVDVAGWPGNRSWINTTTITQRWEFYQSQLGLALVFSFGNLGEITRAITTEAEDVEVICQQLVDYFMPRGLQFSTDFEAALVNFKGEIPPEYFVNGNWNIDYWAVPIQFRALLAYLSQLPEFQLK
ncbi:MAG: DUF1800 domain-containing protein [Bacteroidota bacterium]